MMMLKWKYDTMSIGGVKLWKKMNLVMMKSQNFLHNLIELKHQKKLKKQKYLHISNNLQLLLFLCRKCQYTCYNIIGEEYE